MIKWLLGAIGTLLAALAAMGGVIALLLKSRSNQKQRAEDAEKRADQTEEVLGNVAKRKEIERTAGADVVDRLRDKYTRD